MRSIAFLLPLVASGVSMPALAQSTLYKHVDKAGNVTYSDAIPHENGGKASSLWIDPTGNTVMPFRAPAPAESSGPARQSVSGNTAGADGPAPGTTRHHWQRIRETRARIESLRNALEYARDNASDSDFFWVDRANHGGAQFGGHRVRVPTEEFHARMTALEQELASAEQELKLLERSVEF